MCFHHMNLVSCCFDCVAFWRKGRGKQQVFIECKLKTE